MSHSSEPSGQYSEALRQTISRIRAVVEEERELLASANIEGFDRIVARKDQLAIELSRHVKHVGSESADKNARALLDEAAQALQGNAELLRRHIEAVSEVASLICNVLVNANSDGTYTSNVAGRGMRL